MIKNNANFWRGQNQRYSRIQQAAGKGTNVSVGPITIGHAQPILQIAMSAPLALALVMLSIKLIKKLRNRLLSKI